MFWAYMLHCRGGMFYVGHTDNLDARIGAHQSGLIAGFTSDHLPVELVWSQDFPSRYEALTAERQIKGWSRAKKMALIRGDWGEVSRLAKKKNGPSTSSGRTVKEDTSVDPKAVRAEPVEALSLVCHPQAPNVFNRTVDATISIHDGKWVLGFVVTGPLPEIPRGIRSQRCDGLWKTTCFEMFLRGSGEAYDEFNFSPSTQWAAYRFSAYRGDPGDLDIATPIVQPIENGLRIVLDYTPDHPGPWRIALSAVIEETGGTKSYWALKHPPGPPDFHHPDCFALTLPAPE